MENTLPLESTNLNQLKQPQQTNNELFLLSLQQNYGLSYSFMGRLNDGSARDSQAKTSDLSTEFSAVSPVKIPADKVSGLQKTLDEMLTSEVMLRNDSLKISKSRDYNSICVSRARTGNQSCNFQSQFHRDGVYENMSDKGNMDCLVGFKNYSSTNNQGPLLCESPNHIFKSEVFENPEDSEIMDYQVGLKLKSLSSTEENIHRNCKPQYNIYSEMDTKLYAESGHLDYQVYCRSYPSNDYKKLCHVNRKTYSSFYSSELAGPTIISPLMKWILLFLSVLLLHHADAKYIEGELKTSEKWAFLTRFCFLSNDGTFSFDIEYDMEYATQKLLLYYDSPHQWPAVYKSDKTCEEKEGVMKRENNQFINLTLFSINSECEIIRAVGDKASYHCQGSRSFRSVRERWWFIAVSNCDSTMGLQLKYKITMTNGFNYWTKHFSADEFYILRTDLIVMVLELGILFLSLLATAELKSRQLFHTTYRLYLAGVVIQVIGLIFLNLHYAKYGYNGIGLPESKLIGKILLAVTNILMVLMLLLMGKGFNITRGRLRQASAIRLTTFICIFCITYSTLFIYEQKVFDPGEVLYKYESPAGYGLVILRCLAWVMFLYACFFTIKHYPEKYKFYSPFFFFYTLWFVSGPIVILISNHVIDKWVREKVVNAVELSITILGHAFFLFLTRPSAANKNFPYHVRTTQITALETSSSGVVGNNTLDAFSGHTYAPDFVEPKNHTTPDLFLVSGAVEMRPIQPPRSIIKDDKSFPHYPPTAPSAAMFQAGNTPS